VLSIGTKKLSIENCRVLVVEDDPASRRALLMLLKLRGFQAIPARNLSEARQQLEANPCSVLLDLMLPDGNGSSLLEHIRSNDLPIRVAITSGASNWQSMLGNGRLQPDAYFSKPLHFDRLVEWLSESCDAEG
jgi:DNA-binding NtrC family response regulator